MADNYLQMAIDQGRFEGSGANRASDMENYVKSKGGAAGAAPTSTSADLSQYDSLLGGIGSNVDFAKTISAPADTAMANYLAYLKGKPSLQDVSTQFETAAGLPGARKTATSLQGQVNDLSDAIRGVKNTVIGTTKESMVTQAQRDSMVTHQQQPLQENLSTISTNLAHVSDAISQAEKLVADKLNLYGQDQTNQAEPFKVQLQYLQDQAARLTTAFSADQQNKLNVTLAKIQRGEAISDQDRSEAFSMLQKEKDYQNTLKTLQIQSDNNIKEAQKSSASSLGNSLKEIGATSAANINEKKVQSGLNINEATVQQALDIAKSKATAKATSGSGHISEFLPPPGTTPSTQGTPASTATLVPPSMSAPNGARQESPAGSGIVWTMVNGQWT